MRIFFARKKININVYARLRKTCRKSYEKRIFRLAARGDQLSFRPRIEPACDGDGRKVSSRRSLSSRRPSLDSSTLRRLPSSRAFSHTAWTARRGTGPCSPLPFPSIKLFATSKSALPPSLIPAGRPEMTGRTYCRGKRGLCCKLGWDPRVVRVGSVFFPYPSRTGIRRG